MAFARLRHRRPGAEEPRCRVENLRGVEESVPTGAAGHQYAAVREKRRGVIRARENRRRSGGKQPGDRVEDLRFHHRAVLIFPADDQDLTVTEQRGRVGGPRPKHPRGLGSRHLGQERGCR